MLRSLGLILLLLAVGLFGWDAWASWQAGALQLQSAGTLWYAIDQNSLNLAQAGVQRTLSPVLWDSVIVNILLMPAWSIPGLIGVVLWIFGPKD